MALLGSRDGRNFGYGRQLSYAGPQALRYLLGGGHYGTVMQPLPGTLNFRPHNRIQYCQKAC